MNLDVPFRAERLSAVYTALYRFLGIVRKIAGIQARDLQWPIAPLAGWCSRARNRAGRAARSAVEFAAGHRPGDPRRLAGPGTRARRRRRGPQHRRRGPRRAGVRRGTHRLRSTARSRAAVRVSTRTAKLLAGLHIRNVRVARTAWRRASSRMGNSRRRRAESPSPERLAALSGTRGWGLGAGDQRTATSARTITAEPAETLDAPPQLTTSLCEFCGFCVECLSRLRALRDLRDFVMMC
jgi:hypothetical protein